MMALRATSRQLARPLTRGFMSASGPLVAERTVNVNFVDEDVRLL